MRFQTRAISPKGVKSYGGWVDADHISDQSTTDDRVSASKAAEIMEAFPPIVKITYHFDDGNKYQIRQKREDS